MAKTYIRIYCNNTKVRSTGSESWYRKEVLKELMLNKDLNFNITTDDKSCELLRDTLARYTAQSVMAEGESENYSYRVELVRTNTFGKRILKTVCLPWVLLDNGEFFCNLDEGRGKGIDMNDKNT